MRAHALTGHTLGEVAAALQVRLPENPRRSKGFAGALVERALGASGGSRSGPDFPDLGVELKTLPLSRAGRPCESTFVCSINLRTLAGESWPASTARRKLDRMLFVPLDGAATGPLSGRRFHPPRLYRLGGADEAILRADWEELSGRIGADGGADLSARVGRYLQVRPKAAHGGVRVPAGPTGDDAWLGGAAICPRGFYLRARFTRGLFSPDEVFPPDGV